MSNTSTLKYNSLLSKNLQSLSNRRTRPPGTLPPNYCQIATLPHSGGTTFPGRCHSFRPGCVNCVAKDCPECANAPGGARYCAKKRRRQGRLFESLQAAWQMRLAHQPNQSTQWRRWPLRSTQWEHMLLWR